LGRIALQSGFRRTGEKTKRMEGTAVLRYKTTNRERMQYDPKGGGKDRDRGAVDRVVTVSVSKSSRKKNRGEDPDKKLRRAS